MWLIEGEAEAEHARTFPPVLDDLQAIFALQIEVPKNAKLVWMLAHCVDRLQIDGLAQRARWMKHCGVDPGFRHPMQRVVHSIGGNLSVVRRHPGIFPKVDLRVDDQHLTTSILPPARGFKEQSAATVEDARAAG
jgi:hypothetical protein